MVYSGDIHLHHEDFPYFTCNSWFSRYLILQFFQSESHAEANGLYPNPAAMIEVLQYGENIHEIPMYNG